MVQSPPRWVLGVVVATPVLGFMQGTALLLDYRKHYLNVPYPLSPSQGLVVAVDERTHKNKTTKQTPESSSSSHSHRQGQERKQPLYSSLAQFLQSHHGGTNGRGRSPPTPLRLLVIGDSLAAGVGVMQGATPVLPESIARTLSQHFNGRPVYWTCIGRPGALLPEILHKIETHTSQQHYDNDNDKDELNTTTTHKVLLWNPITVVGPPTVKERLFHRMYCIEEWWKNRKLQPAQRQRHQEPQPPISRDQEEAATSNLQKDPPKSNPILQWWSLLREDARTFVKACQGELEDDDDDDDDDLLLEGQDKGEPNASQSSSSSLPHRSAVWKRRRLQRRLSSRQWEELSMQGDYYDIAVVLTGPNDLKHVWLPFMFRHSSTGEDDDGKTVPERLQKVVQALRARMKSPLRNPSRNTNTTTAANDNHATSTTTESETDDKSDTRSTKVATTGICETRGSTMHPPTSARPLVVFPAAPIALVPQLRSVPMRWFVFAIFNRLENTKKQLAEQYPGEIVFVESPPVELFSAVQEGKGELYEDIQAQEVLLKLTSVTRRFQEQFDAKIKEYRDKWAQRIQRQARRRAKDTTAGSPEGTDTTDNNDDDDDDDEDNEESGGYNHPDEFYPDYDKTKSLKALSILSLDQLHPSDEGYEIWGRHIASTVLKHWNPTSDESESDG